MVSGGTGSISAWKNGGRAARSSEITPDQPENKANRSAVVAHGLHGERVHHVLQDKARAAHRVDVHLVVCGAHGIHIEHSLARHFSTCRRAGPSWSPGIYRWSVAVPWASLVPVTAHCYGRPANLSANAYPARRLYVPWVLGSGDGNDEPARTLRAALEKWFGDD